MNFDKDYIQAGLENIKTLLTKIPCVQFVATSEKGEAFWWLKFGIDINSKIAWIVVQELGHILNYLSVDDKLPTTFYPVSPPPYMNGKPEDFLSWVIEPVIPYVDTNNISAYLDGRLPKGMIKKKVGCWTNKILPTKVFANSKKSNYYNTSNLLIASSSGTPPENKKGTSYLIDYLSLSAGCRLQLSNRFGDDLNKIASFCNRYLIKIQTSA